MGVSKDQPTIKAHTHQAILISLPREIPRASEPLMSLGRLLIGRKPVSQIHLILPVLGT